MILIRRNITYHLSSITYHLSYNKKIILTIKSMYNLPELGYSYNALEPHIDARTMEIHHTKHHQGYTNNLNAILEKYPALAETPLEKLLFDIDHTSLEQLKMTEADKKTLRNNGGGYLNHKLFWEIMNPNNPKDEDLSKEIAETFGSLDAMKETFNKNAGSRFGSGWSWLVRNKDEKLELYSTANQDSPYMRGDTPILGLDVWEHAYYLNYQNKRGDYVETWWKTIKIV